MSTDTSKLRSKLAKLNKSLDELESQLEPLFSKPLPETLLALDTIQQAELQVIIPYVVYDLVFVYLKSRGIDPKTHRVVAELERIREYFDKIKLAEETDRKRKSGIDKAAADRFIRRAIAQAKNAQPVNEPDEAAPAASASSNIDHVPVKVTGKMIAREEYQRKLEELGSEEEDDLEVFDEDPHDESEEAMDMDGPPEDARPTRLDKGKGRASEDLPSQKRKRSRVGSIADHGQKANLSTSVQPTPGDDCPQGTSISISEGRDTKNAAKSAKRKAKKP